MKEMKLMLLVLLVAVAGCKSSDNSLTLLRAKEWQLKSKGSKESSANSDSGI